MREIKTYIRPEKVDEVVHDLYHAEIGHLTLVHVRSFGRTGLGVDPKHWKPSLETGTLYSEMVKLEMVCSEPEVDGLVKLIRDRGRTGEPGDGIVFVAPVDRAVKVRTGEEGRGILR